MSRHSSREPFVLENRSIDSVRQIKVICIGAGINGIIAGIRLPQRIPSLLLTIYEKNADVGGTWFENTYPGVACDLPAHTYNLSFEPKRDWSSFYANGGEILEYWKRVARKYGVYRFTRFGMRCGGAKWDEEAGKWVVTVENVNTGERLEDECDILISCTGFVNKWKFPDIPGIEDFQGKMMHTANWQHDVEYKGKRVAVIGNGSSGIQIVPNLQPNVKVLDHYVRGPTWISFGFGEGAAKRYNPQGGNVKFTTEQIKAFTEDHDTYITFRKAIESELQGAYPATHTGSEMQIMGAELFTKSMKEKLSKKPEIFKKILPEWAPACRRISPGPGYLEALVEDNVDYITTPIKRFVKNGIETVDGEVREVDIIVCATGFDMTNTPRWPTTGRNNIDLGQRIAARGYSEAYMSVAMADFPNYFMQTGPNFSVGNGNMIIVFERITDYFVKCIQKIQREGIKSMVVKKEAVEDFCEFTEAYFPRTVFAQSCSSWFKIGKNGRINQLWPGSALHELKAFELPPRWEDYEYTRFNRNRLAWWGDGWTEMERNKGDLVSHYLDKIDIPPLPLAN